MRSRLFSLLALTWISCVAEEHEVSFSSVDRWYEVYLGEAKVGYAHDRMALQNDRVLSQNTFVMKLKRAGQTIEVRSAQETIEKPSGELVEFHGNENGRNSNHQAGSSHRTNS